jgi:hypothetical protein
VKSDTNVVFDALDANAFVKLIGGDSVDLNVVYGHAAHFPEPSMLPASQRHISRSHADEVCGEAPRLAAKKEDVENDAGVCFFLGFVFT